MPFTPFHLGPALAIGLPLRKYLHVPTFIVANMVLDVEGFLVMLLRLYYPLHGYVHTLLLAVAVGLLLGYCMFKLERRLQPSYKMLLLETNQIYSAKFFLFAGVAGTVLHVLFDATLYSDIRPFFPSSANPLLNTCVLSGFDAYTLSLWMGIFGIAFYAVLAIFHLHKTMASKKQL